MFASVWIVKSLGYCIWNAGKCSALPAVFVIQLMALELKVGTTDPGGGGGRAQVILMAAKIVRMHYSRKEKTRELHF
jgi:hypothetical protein